MSVTVAFLSLSKLLSTPPKLSHTGVGDPRSYRAFHVDKPLLSHADAFGLRLREQALICIPALAIELLTSRTQVIDDYRPPVESHRTFPTDPTPLSAPTIHKTLEPSSKKIPAWLGSRDQALDGWCCYQRSLQGCHADIMSIAAFRLSIWSLKTVQIEGGYFLQLWLFLIPSRCPARAIHLLHR